MESIRKAEDKELERTAEVEFVENREFDEKAETVVRTMIDKIKEKLGESDIEKSTKAWREFLNIQQEGKETTKDYVSRIEQSETKMKNASIKMPDKVLALHMMMKSSMEPQSKENVLTKTDLTDDKRIYTSMKKSMREMKSNITMKDKDDDGKREENRTCQKDRDQYGHSKPQGERSKDGHVSEIESNQLQLISREDHRNHREHGKGWKKDSGGNGRNQENWRYGRDEDRC